MESTFNVIIVAGGTGQRMGAAIPKQFLMIEGKPILYYTLDAFTQLKGVSSIIIAAPEDHIQTMQELILHYFPTYPIDICIGGATRFHSVQNALKLTTATYVMVHDAVRPCINPEWLATVQKHTIQHGSAIPYVKMNDSIREYENNSYKTRNRENFIRIQTPQCFESEKLKKAYLQEFNHFTDDASVWESAGNTLSFIEGLERNIKITTPDDLILAHSFLVKK